MLPFLGQSVSQSVSQSVRNVKKDLCSNILQQKRDRFITVNDIFLAQIAVAYFFVCLGTVRMLQCHMRNNMIIKTSDPGKIWKEAALAYFKKLS